MDAERRLLDEVGGWRSPGARGAAVSSPAVVLGHGMWSDGRVFRSMTRHMRSGARVIPIDFPGHGQRSGEAPARTVEALAQEYFRAIPEGAAPAILAGISMGAIAALHAALLRPDAVSGLLLFAGSASAERAHRRLLYRTLALAYRAIGPAPPLRWGVQHVAFGPDCDPGDARTLRLIRQAKAVPRETVTASLRLLAERPSVMDRLHEITVPVSVVVGDHDRVFPAARSRTLSSRLVDARLHVLPDVGHAVVVERPAAAARLADQLVDRVRAATWLIARAMDSRRSPGELARRTPARGTLSAPHTARYPVPTGRG